MIDHVESELGRLPEPVPPGTIAATVMARVSSLHAAPAPSATSISSLREMSAWAMSLAGLATVAVSWIAGGRAAVWLPDLNSQQLDPARMGLAVGVLVYLAGLLARFAAENRRATARGLRSTIRD